MNKTKIAILHLLPLEYYPPVTNLADLLAEVPDAKVLLLSSHNPAGREVYRNSGVSIRRVVYPAYVKGALQKLFAFLSMFFSTTLALIRFKPEVLLYYEPHSAYPAYLYTRFLSRKSRLFIHYHEYYAPEEFWAPHMQSVRYFHQKECSWLYRKAEWISQTNPRRLELFAADYPFIPRERLHTLANYPPKSWYRRAQSKSPSEKVRLLYLGALSFENTYIRPMVEFVLAHPDIVQLDIYSYNMHSDVAQYLISLQSSAVRLFREGVSYHRIPDLAAGYDIGLILYNSHNANYALNAPNKLFEYLACGLTVWVPEGQEGCRPYVQSGMNPEVRAVDFERLSMTLLLERSDTKRNSDIVPYSCNCEYQSLFLAMGLEGR
ncbi:MAG: hypothetical protein AB7C90_08595 [Bacteroidales bacterium]